VVVNVYFPQEQAQDALEMLEEELLPEAPPAEGSDAPATESGDGAPAPETEEPSAPPSRAALLPIPDGAPKVDADALGRKLAADPEVVAAYRRMAKRKARTDSLRDNGLVGEGYDGLLHALPGRKLDVSQRRTVEEENRDRRKVIRALARAALEAEGASVTDANLDRILPEAGRAFARQRRRRAHPGWWVQKADGGWKQTPSS